MSLFSSWNVNDSQPSRGPKNCAPGPCMAQTSVSPQGNHVNGQRGSSWLLSTFCSLWDPCSLLFWARDPGELWWPDQIVPLLCSLWCFTSIFHWPKQWSVLSETKCQSPKLCPHSYPGRHGTWHWWAHDAEHWHWLLRGMMKAGRFHRSGRRACPRIDCHFLVTLWGTADARAVWSCINARHQRSAGLMLAQRAGSTAVLLINELLAGGCRNSASPNKHMQRWHSLWLKLVKKKVEASFCLLPSRVSHKVKAWELCELTLCTKLIFFTCAQQLFCAHQLHSQNQSVP